MVYGGTIYFLFYFHTEETAAARGVGQQFLLVAGADEGGNAWQLAIIGAMRFSEGWFLQLHQVFQCCHVADTISIELIHVDKTEE